MEGLMINFRRFAFMTTIATYLLIFIGGLVRVSGAGLGCPDWPKCFGRWIPPVSASQLPSGMDPSTFNFTLAWIEYFNRLVGVTVGILILITAILAIKYYARVKSVWIPAWAAAILTAYQGWQGSQVVSSKLEPIIVSAHLIIALIIVSLLIYSTLKAYSIERGSPEKRVLPPKLKIEIIILWIAAIIQILLGTQVRSAVEILSKQFPLTPDSDIIGMVGGEGHVHLVLGILIIGFAIHLARIILKESDNITSLARQSVYAITILMIAQLVLGFVLYVIGMPALIQVFHLWVASLFIGMLLILYFEVKWLSGGEHAK